MKRILIANRGEIAVRIIRTCRRLGIETVALYSDADRDHPHTKLADFAFHIGASPAKESYLNVDKVLEIATKSGADAIHPGYGFLSENPEFVRACAKARLTFIGPSAKTMAALGNKDAARAAANKVNVPTIPGYDGQKQDLAAIRGAATKLGFPVLLKARAGGGGKGMRLVQKPEDLEHALSAAKREADTFFSDPHVIVEKVVEQPRHIEVQVIGDTHGNVIHLFERDCTLQRRHQKVIEESPSPALSDALRTEILSAAIAIARSCELSNATTFEFLVNPRGQFYFLEANCRIQVEHPVTEMVTGLDLIELQIRAARGEVLPIKQADVRLHGAAIESRVYAESPEKGFIPRPGAVLSLTLPELSPVVRVDHGLAEGVAISTHYDAMVAKVICWGETRELAIARSIAAINSLEVYPLENNQQFLIGLLEHDAVRSNAIHTTFIDQKLHELIKPPRLDLSTTEAAAIAAAFTLSYGFNAGTRGSFDPFSRIAAVFAQTPAASHYFPAINWRIHDDARGADITHKVEIRDLQTSTTNYQLTFVIDGQEVAASIPLNIPLPSPTARFSIELAGRLISPHVSRHVLSGTDCVTIGSRTTHYLATVHYDTNDAVTGVEKSLVVASPLPGKLLALRVKAGSDVSVGTVVAVIESMKMEHTLQAPMAGKIAEILVKAGANVREGEIIARLEPLPN